MLDLQKCLARPLLTNGDSFYLRKHWTVIEERNEMASGIFEWAMQELRKSYIEVITVWSDHCAGQNRNGMTIACYLWLLHTFKPLKVIYHKYPLKGHTHMDVDIIHIMNTHTHIYI
ncbi:hypothetical protein PR048_026848 [Dryococelus australis]|uniref:DUF7869 domain-containing protein n=1 Tax=Dryococelus australis TaxID=614101 RepID=A0ABQ9GMH8_9NEOP|nr:hypothetical protein PR048_026848 [Dryococelus australis]